MELSDYVTLVVTVPETHADAVRDAMGKAGAGKVGKLFPLQLFILKQETPSLRTGYFQKNG